MWPLGGAGQGGTGRATNLPLFCPTLAGELAVPHVQFPSKSIYAVHCSIKQHQFCRWIEQFQPQNRTQPQYPWSFKNFLGHMRFLEETSFWKKYIHGQYSVTWAIQSSLTLSTAGLRLGPPTLLWLALECKQSPTMCIGFGSGLKTLSNERDWCRSIKTVLKQAPSNTKDD